jgi:potassium efflux system protein
MHPRRGVFGVSLSTHRQAWPWRLRYTWYPLSVAWPLALVGLILYGYYYTATHLFFRIGDSFWSIVGAIVLYHLMLRWAMIAEQRLSLARSLAARKATRKAKAAQEAGEAAGEGVPDSFEPPESSMGKIGEQTQALLRAVAAVILVMILWPTWADIAPLFGLLDQITLWHNATVVNGVESLQPVTLWNLGLTVVALALTLIAVQNLPGFLEISFLRRISLARGTQYAITTISRYVIIAVGVIIASNMIGLSWSKVQWLLAGLTVGLGFGLQEIFANFISGLILLFERPIRIGDTVTVGSTSGTVTRIQTRATTITDWDLKELIIPNKSFVTGDVVNWTLTDPVTRLIIRVGVAYGSDIELTEKLMYDIAKANPLVLSEPPPTVFFCGFGDSALTFELRVFFKDILKRMPLSHELNKAINNAFAEQGIEIAFPQRDIHIRSVDSAVTPQDIVSTLKPMAQN